MALIQTGTTGPITQDFVSTGDLLRSDGLMFGKLFRRYDERDFLYFLEANQNWAVADDTVINWHEKGFIKNNVKIASFTGGASGGATAVVTIAASSHVASGSRSPFSPNTVCKLADNYLFVDSKDTTTPGAHTITVKPINPNATLQLDTVLLAGRVLVPITNQYAEGTSYNESSSNLPERFQENIGIVKNKKTITGTQATNKTKIDLGDGKFYYTYEADKELFIEHKLDICYGLLLGPGGSTTDAAGNTVNMAKGVYRQIEERGSTYEYNSVLTMNDIDNWTRTLVREMAPKEVLSSEGHESCIQIENLMTDAMKSGGRSYLENKQGLGGQGMKMIDFTNDGFQKNGFMFYRKKFPEFNNPIITYGNEQSYSADVMLTPMALVKDPVTKNEGFTMRIGYKSAPGPKGLRFDRKFQLKFGGDSAPSPDSEVDEINLRYLTECGVALVNANQGIIVSKA